MAFIENISAMEILDSRGRPTVKAYLQLRGGAMVSPSVPSGASTGSAEAIELRDGDPNRYGGLGCRKAVANINGAISSRLTGAEFYSCVQLDRALMELDGTRNKSKLGANAILAVSIAFCRARAMQNGRELFEEFEKLVPVVAEEMIDRKAKRLVEEMGADSLDTVEMVMEHDEELTRLPLPQLTVNLFSGGKHAGGIGPAIQDVLVAPIAGKSIVDGLSMVYAVYQAAAKLIRRKYGMGPLTADEGGLAPPVQTAEELLDDAVAAIKEAGFVPGRDVAICVDVASSHFYLDGRYHLAPNEPALRSAQMIDHLARWIEKYPIISVEDGLAEDDWENWRTLCETLGKRVMVIGDDLLCTNPERIRKAIELKAANALLLKVNQIGTLSEAAEAYRLARQAGWKVVISARSGETEDNWLADLAVGWGGDQIKVGSITQSERLAKYNRLLEIEGGFGSCAVR